MTIKYLILNLKDNVGLATGNLKKNSKVQNISLRQNIAKGFKFSLKKIKKNHGVFKYGQYIGNATKTILPGEVVHTKNLKFCINNFNINGKSTKNKKENLKVEKKTFFGFKRSNGEFGTRNYIGIISSVNCANTVARSISEYFSKKYQPNILLNYKNIDDVVSLIHNYGCAMGPEDIGIKKLQKTIQGYIAHPNFSHVLLIGLGCETNQIKKLITEQNLNKNKNFYYFNIQDVGGTSKAIEKGIAIIKKILPLSNSNVRSKTDVKNLKIGLQCGGSDSFSGITSNPSLGYAMDLLIHNGGTAILSETPEIYGAEHILYQRCINKRIRNKLQSYIKWWEEYSKINNTSLNNNPSAGNIKGGLTTILEKSLGAYSKGGSSKLVEVVGYAEKIKKNGLIFMDSPGYDPVSATGQIASGANMICFTTGLGSAFGSIPAPTIKLSSNSELFQKQGADIDIDCGKVLSKNKSVQKMGVEIYNEILNFSSGKKTKSENFFYGQNEFVPWVPGALL